MPLYLHSRDFPSSFVFTSFHLCVTQRQTRDVSNAFIKDVNECVKEVMKDPQKKAEGAVSIVSLPVW